MPGDEFSLIDTYFSAIGRRNSNTRLGIGDDAAVCTVPEGYQLVSSMDTLVEGIHFLAGTSPADIAHKALAVNLSDLAAMAAEPKWFLLSITLPQIDAAWMGDFSEELNRVAETYDIELIGGDTSRGPLSITIQTCGMVPDDAYLTRAGAKPGDRIVVSGQLGSAALGLAHLQERHQLPESCRTSCIDALLRPRPRLELIPFLRQYANAAIDLSDGLIADLGHIIGASECGAVIRRDALPVNDWIQENDAYQYAIAAGDDYEICCCVAEKHCDQIEAWNRENPQSLLSVIGEICDSGYYLHHDGQTIELERNQGYRHFV